MKPQSQDHLASGGMNIKIIFRKVWIISQWLNFHNLAK